MKRKLFDKILIQFIKIIVKTIQTVGGIIVCILILLLRGRNENN